MMYSPANENQSGPECTGIVTEIGEDLSTVKTKKCTGHSSMTQSLLLILAYMPCWAVNPWLNHWNGSIGLIIAKSKR